MNIPKALGSKNKTKAFKKSFVFSQFNFNNRPSLATIVVSLSEKVKGVSPMSI